MRVVVHNVDHGQCIVVSPPDGDPIMIDCGVLSSGDVYWWPSIHYFNQRFGALVLTNLDEDHAQDFRLVLQHAKPNRILWNPTVGHHELILLKRQGMRDGIQAFAEWMALPKDPSRLLPEPNFGSVQVRWYCNRYQPGVIDDTNNLSLVVVLQYGTFKMLISGDMERAGWNNLLNLPEFCLDLIGVSVFVASHHGRESGCVTELFDFWHPEIFIISDEGLKYASQETTNWYRNRARGIPVLGTQDRRYVYTTRNDGSLQIDVAPNGKGLIQPVDVRVWPASSPLAALTLRR